MHSVKRGVSACGLCVSVLVALGGVFGAAAAGTDGLSLTTNDWYDASFTALTVDTPIAQGGTVGITRGAGSWTAVPSSGTAKIVEDADNNSATVLAVNASGEELEFTPAALQNATGMETAQFRVKAEAVDALTAISDAQAAFALYSADGANYALMGYVSDGAGAVWTNLTGVTAGTLANTWYDLTMDFCGGGSARVVRFAVNGTILADSDGTTWFPVVKQNATTINSLAFTGVGSLQSFSGDSLAAASANVARYNGTDYPSVATAIAAGEVDSWANGSVMLLANAEWTPTAAGTYNIDLGSYTLSNTGDYTISAGETAGTVTAARIYTWNGSSDTWFSAANWTVGSDAHAAATYPGENTTDPFTVVFAKNATFASSETIALGDMTVQAAGYTVTLPSVSVPNLVKSGNSYSSTAYTRIESGTVIVVNDGFREHNVTIAQDATLILNKATTAQSKWLQWFKGAGALIVDGVKFDYSANGNYGSAVTGFEGTLIGRNGAEIETTGNGNTSSIQNNQLGQGGKFVFSGVAVTAHNSNTRLSNSAFEIVAGTVNTMTTFTLPLAKTTIVDGGVTLDTAEQYVAMTVDAYAGTVPAVSSDLTAAGWDVIRSTNGVSKTVFVLTHNPTYTWTGAADDGLWATPANWKVGAYVPATAPGAGDTVSITTEEESLAIVVTDGQNVGTLTKGENVTLVGPGPYEATVTEGVVALARVPSTFVWTDGESGNSWTSLSNWTVNGRETDVLPGSDDVALMSSESSVTISGVDGSISNLVISANVTLSGGGTLSLKTTTGDAVLSLAGVTLSVNNSSGHAELSADMEIVDETVNTIKGTTQYKYVGIMGDLTGKGTLQIDESNGNQKGACQFFGSMVEFAGTIKVINYYSSAHRDCLFVSSSASSSAKARWDVWGCDTAFASIGSGSSKGSWLGAKNQTFYFGALNGFYYLPSNVSGVKVEVGARGEDCEFGGDPRGSSYSLALVKVGNAKLVYTGKATFGAYEIKGGVFEIGHSTSHTTFVGPTIKFLGEGATLAVSATVMDPETSASTFVDPSAYIANSTYPITFSNAVNEVHTWATALASSNKGGLVKKGEGTLTLGAAPLYPGDTYLDGGTLKIPAAADVAVKTHVSGKKVVTSAETIENVEYTVYTLGDKKPVLILVY